MDKSPIEMIYDENNTDNIVMYDEDGEELEFEQVALIPLKKRDHVILKPVEQMEGVADDEAVVFAIKTDKDGEEYLEVVDDDDIIDEVFEEYYAMLAEEGII